jgi:imidazolonepropionase-like amidohydrolase
MKRLLPILGLLCASLSPAQIAVLGETIYTMEGPPIRDGVVLIEGARIRSVGPRASVRVPDGYRVVRAKVVTPGLIDARSSVGLSGMLNVPGHDQDQIERSAPIQPELRAIDAYNPLERLVGYIREFGVTAVHTGHATGELVSGQTFVAKTDGVTADEAAVRPLAMVSATLDPSSFRQGRSPGNRSKQMSMLREELGRARAEMEREEEGRPRDLRREMLFAVLRKEVPLLVFANRAQDIANALRLQEEFGFLMVLDGAVEGYLMADQIRAAGVPVIVHPTMSRASGEQENLTWENAAILKRAGVPVAIQGGFEGYVPKVRVVLFEAALAAVNGLGFEGALAAVTIDAARILGVADRIGSLAPGKDADLALYDGDPFEYTTHCVGTIVNGRLVFEGRR